MSTKREREYERRRYEKWQQKQAQRRQVAHRRQVAAGAIAGVLVVALAAVGVYAAATGNDDAPVITPSGSDTLSTSGTPTSGAAKVGNGGVLPDASAAQGRTWTGTITTNTGAIGIELDGAAAPQAVANFVTLAGEGYFDSTPCHRLVTSGIYVLQCGDPTGTGTGGPGYTFGPIENAPSDNVYPAGTIAMARVGGDASSMGSQFFLVYADSTIPADAVGGYTVLGKITSGLDVVQAIADAGVSGGTDGAPASPVVIESVETQ